MDYQEFNNEMNLNYYRANCYHTMKNPDNDATSGNHHVINATYHVISKKLNPMYPACVEGQKDLSKHINFVALTMVEPGLFIRHPNKAKDHETHDDYIGLIVSNNILGGPIAEDIYEYGQTRRFGLKYFYDNLKEKWPSIQNIFNSWFGRFPWMPAVIKVGANKNLNVFNTLGYCTYILSDIYFNKNKTDTSGRILTWLANSVVKGNSKLLDKCIDKWENKMMEVYPGGMGEVLGIYHGVEHPFAKSMRGRL
jgi:hypothetical protein